MTISSATFGAAAVTEQSNAHDVRSDRDHSPHEFAGMLAGVVQSSPKPIEPKETREEGTSELDRADEAEHEDSKTKRARSASKSETDDSTKVSADDTSQINQSVAALDPELQAKLARVMARMRDETGHDVAVAETLRTQTRQDALFAQGREAPGPVVTWTRNSKHTQGRAVDLVLDSGTAGVDAYEVLQRIAGEEGLRTLGARDPGHLELPTGGANGAADAASLIPTEPADASGQGQVPIARLAQIAQVSQLSVETPAQVAHVATVARVAAPSDVSRTATFAAPQPNGSAHSNDAGSTQTVQPARTVSGDTQHAARRFGADTGDSDSGTKGEHRGYSALAAAVALREASSATSSTQSVGATPTMTAADRAAKLLAALEDAPARPLSQITMSVDAGNGTTDRVQLAMRGSSLNATIDAADARAAQTMTSRSDELVRALSRDGIELEALRVRAAAGATTTQAATSAPGASDTNTNSRFERGNAWQHQQDRQRSQDERRQQQRDQRGGQGQ